MANTIIGKDVGIVDDAPSRLLEKILWHVGLAPNRVPLWEDRSITADVFEWIGRKIIATLLIIVTLQGILFETKTVYAQQPYTKGSQGASAIYQNQRVMGSGESDVSRNNMGSVLLRQKSGRTTNQTFDMSHGSAIIWGRYLPEISRGRIDVTYMEKNPVNGDVRLVEKIVGPQDFARYPVDMIPDNGVRKYYTNKAGVKFNPLEQFNASYGGWDWGVGPATNQLYDLSFGAMTAAMGLVAKRYNANRGYAMFGHFYQRESDGEVCCCKVLGACICDRPWYQVDAGVRGEWYVMTTMDNAGQAGAQSMYTIRNINFTPSPNSPPAEADRCVRDAGIFMSPVAPLDLWSDQRNPIGGYDEIGIATRNNEYDRDACQVRSSMNLVVPSAGADFNNAQYEYWSHRKYYSCGIPFILVVIIAVIVTAITYGAGAAIMGSMAAASGATAGAATSGIIASAATAGLISGALMVVAHVAMGGSLTDTVSMDQAGMMILGAAVGGAIGGSGLISQMAGAVAESAELTGSFTASATAGDVTALFEVTNLYPQITFSSSGSTLGTIGLVESAAGIGSAFASDPTGQAAATAINFTAGMLVGMGMSEANAALAAPNIPTSALALTYGKTTPSGPTGDEFDYRTAVASCFMDPPMNSSVADYGANSCRGLPASTWATYAANRQCNPASPAGASDSCAVRYNQFSDIMMMKMGASIGTDQQIVNDDLTTPTGTPAINEPVIYLPKAGGGRPFMDPNSKANNPTGPVQ